MPSLQIHMLRVAGVASVICDNFEGELDNKSITTACLLHDMGNIIKFNLGFIPQFLEPQGIAYWQNIKDEFIKKYGTDEHAATAQISKELKIDERSLEILDAIGFSKSAANAECHDYSKKIAAYSDHRVSPHGITSLEERLLSGRKRFEANQLAKNNIDRDKDRFEELFSSIKIIERQIFDKCKIEPEYIDDRSVNVEIDRLKLFEI